MDRPRRPIAQLSQSLVNRIAAGEVIERPASVVKELVENALDAGAEEISIEIEDGGRELIRVIDNGGGIPPADLGLAFASHATSKLLSDEDLFQIATKGFRGEALASIGSVSHSRIISRTAEAPDSCAYEIANRGGAISDTQAASGNVGTTVEVRNLFFNVPARRKFLKGTQTEFGHISEMVLKLALPHPNVAFKLAHNGRQVLDVPRTNAEDRYLAAWPKEFHEQRLTIDLRDAEITLRGIVGTPEIARPTPKYQQLYLNNRPIRDRFVQHALREAYRGLTEPGRYPAAVLLIDMPPADVDVNVHPTKVEVRFRDSGRIHGLVMAAVRERLLGSDLTPLAQPRGDDATPFRADMREKLATFFRAMPSEVVAPAPATSSDPTLARFELHAQPAPQTSIDFTSRALREDDASARVAAPNASSGTNDRSQDHGLASVATTDNTTPVASAPHATQPNAPAIQLHNSYLVAQSDDGMIIIDQHALHERIMYEELHARLTRGPLESQRLLIPQTLPVSSRQMAMLEQIQPLLARLGIEVSSFGPNTVAVQAFPSFLERLEPAVFVNELLERGEQELLDLHEEELLHEILDMMACKAAVKAGDPLSAAEIEALLARRELVERSSNCPHGRPTTLRLSLRDLEKQFKRTGF